MDDPAQVILAEPRMLHTQDTEATWWRIVDAPKALAQRGYNANAELVFKLAGDDLPWNNGSWCLQTSADDATDSQVTPATKAPDLTLSSKTLTSLFSGMYGAQTLANWGYCMASQMLSPRQIPYLRPGTNPTARITISLPLCRLLFGEKYYAGIG